MTTIKTIDPGIFLNLTPHNVTVFTQDETIVIPASGRTARVDARSGGFVGIYGGVPIFQNQMFGPIIGLPEPEEVDEKFVLVSRMVAQAAARQRHPLSVARRIVVPDTSPDGAVRDAAGNIRGVRQLILVTP